MHLLTGKAQLSAPPSPPPPFLPFLPCLCARKTEDCAVYSPDALCAAVDLINNHTVGGEESVTTF